jgi:DNA-directed RNA polymerase subunit K/omega
MKPLVPAVTAPKAPGPAADSTAPPVNRFHIATLAFQRAKQLQNGARPRVEDSDHGPTRLALLEVMADTISWKLE